MKELKKLTSFQDKIARGARPKGAAEPWAIQVRGRELWGREKAHLCENYGIYQVAFFKQGVVVQANPT